MNGNFKVIEPYPTPEGYRGPYQEIAMYVRQLLQCEYAMVAVPGKDSIRIQGFAGPNGEKDENLAADLISGLRDWGPLVVGDARLIVAPVLCGGHIMGVLIGYSSQPGAFTTGHLDTLMAYTQVAAGILANAATEAAADTRTSFSTDELTHLFRLITIGEFSACFAHEVKNPLMLIRGHIRFINESLPADAPLRSNFEAIDRASRRIEEITKRMLDFSKKRVRRTEPCDIGNLISDALRFAQPYIRTRFIDVQVHVEPNLPIIDADRWQIVQAIVNILQNAADAMADVQRRVLSVTAGMHEAQMRILISDTGTGIAPENAPRIFDAFFTTKGDRGTGLGLYIAKQVVDEHRGTISVETADERGARFAISLPV